MDCTNTATHEPHDDCPGIDDPFAGIPTDEDYGYPGIPGQDLPRVGNPYPRV